VSSESKHLTKEYLKFNTNVIDLGPLKLNVNCGKTIN
jgi:hypothetical protein